MCKEQKLLRAHLDGELTIEGTSMLQAHLDHCDTCREQENQLQARAHHVQSALTMLSAGPAIDAGFAYARWQARQFAEPTFAFGMFQPDARRSRRTSGIVGSLLAHIGVAGLVLAATALPVLRLPEKEVFRQHIPVLLTAPPKVAAGGGGGGGDHSVVPPDRGRPPQQQAKQFIPPQQVLKNPSPALTLPVAIEAKLDLPQTVDLQHYGNPMDGRSLPSNGPGSGGGIGTGVGGGIGSGDGTGLGDGSRMGFGGGVYRIGGVVSNPQLVSKTDPEYSEEARKAKFQGSVRLTVIIDAAGHVSHIQVPQPLGMGLDEKAIEAVQKWKFRPAIREGVPVPVIANIEVSFRLL